MAHSKSALKRIRTSEKARLVNRRFRKEMKDSVKSVLLAANKEDAQKSLQQTISILDKMAIRGIIHKNKAANQKSRLSLHVKNMS